MRLEAGDYGLKGCRRGQVEGLRLSTDLILNLKITTGKLFIRVGVENDDVAVAKDLSEGGGVGFSPKDDEVAIFIRPAQVGVAPAGDVNRPILVLQGEESLVETGEELLLAVT